MGREPAAARPVLTACTRVQVLQYGLRRPLSGASDLLYPNVQYSSLRLTIQLGEVLAASHERATAICEERSQKVTP